jgi:hypothetical protein
MPATFSSLSDNSWVKRAERGKKQLKVDMEKGRERKRLWRQEDETVYDKRQ